MSSNSCSFQKMGACVDKWVPILGGPALDETKCIPDVNTLLKRTAVVAVAALGLFAVGFVLHLPLVFAAAALVAGTAVMGFDYLKTGRAADENAVEEFVTQSVPRAAYRIRRSLNAANLLIEKKRISLLNKMDELGVSILVGANLNVFEALVKAGAEFYVRDCTQQSGFFYAMEQSNPAFVKCLEGSPVLKDAINYVKEDKNYCRTLWETVNTKEAALFLKKHDIDQHHLAVKLMQMKKNISKEDEDRIALIEEVFK